MLKMFFKPPSRVERISASLIFPPNRKTKKNDFFLPLPLRFPLDRLLHLGFAVKHFKIREMNLSFFFLIFYSRHLVVGISVKFYFFSILKENQVDLNHWMIYVLIAL